MVSNEAQPEPPDRPRGADALDLAALLRDRGGEALSLFDRHVNPAMAAVLRMIGFDISYVRGQGAYLYDEQGRKYIDCLGGYAVFAGGRNHPAIRDVIRQAMELDLPNLPGLGTPRLAGLLAERLVALAPGDLGKVYFASGGGEAIDAAMKFARAFTGRPRVVYAKRAYHGLTMGALSANGFPEFRDGFGPLLGPFDEVPFDDLGSLEHALYADDVAAFIVEPVQGKGVHIPAPDYLRRAKALCEAHGALLIVDEIQTGLGRTGRMWACQHDGAGADWSPDLVVIGKALSGGYVPSSAVLMRDDVHAAVFSSMQHCSRIQNTFGMNDLAMAAGLATLHVLERERIVERTAHVGTHLLDRLRSGLAGFELVKETRGRGLMIAVELGKPASLRLRAGWSLLHRLDESLFCQSVILPLMSDHRILTQVAGHRMDVIKLIPPLVFTREDADVVADALIATIGACHRVGGPVWEVGKRLGAAAVRRLLPTRGR